MGTGGFFRRWSRLKSHGDEARPDERDAGVRGTSSTGSAAASLQRGPAPDASAGSVQPSSGHRASDALAEPALAAGAVGAPLQSTGAQLDLSPVAQTAPHPPVAPPPPGRAPRDLPTLDDVAALGPDSDFSAFVSQGVDKNVQRLAMKKLFSDPHFSVLDGLDVYIDDYTKTEAIPAAVLASLDHAKSVFARMLDNESTKKGEGGSSPAAGTNPADPPPPDHDNDA